MKNPITDDDYSDAPIDAPWSIDCPDCDGKGFTVVAGHAPGCFGGPNCGSTCPVPEQEMCQSCGGSGEVAVA